MVEPAACRRVGDEGGCSPRLPLTLYGGGNPTGGRGNVLKYNYGCGVKELQIKEFHRSWPLTSTCLCMSLDGAQRSSGVETMGLVLGTEPWHGSPPASARRLLASVHQELTCTCLCVMCSTTDTDTLPCEHILELHQHLTLLRTTFSGTGRYETRHKKRERCTTEGVSLQR